MTKKEELQEKLDILKKNRELIPLNELKNGKYSSAYKKLLSEINALLNGYITHKLSLVAIHIHKDEVEKVTELFNEVKPPIKDAIYVWYDADLIDEIIDNFVKQVISSIKKFYVKFVEEESLV